MKSALVMVVVVLLVWSAGCGVERGDPPAASASVVAADGAPSGETFALGTAVTSSGAVPAAASGEIFVRGGVVYLSVNVGSASREQTIAVKWIDPNGNVLREDERDVPRGTQYVPFSSGATSQWTRGDHRAVVIIDGRAVSEKRFAIL